MMMSSNTSAIDAVIKFFDLINKGYFDDAIDMLSDNVLYHNIPMPEMIGRENVRNFHKSFGIGSRIKVDWQLAHIAQDGTRVLTERIDIFSQDDGLRIILPTMGSFVVEDGWITQWRDYFDLASFERQAAALRSDA